LGFGREVRKTPPGRPTYGWKDNIKINLGGMRWGGMDWINMVQNSEEWRALVNTVMKLWVP
jgi:hypothetical protein